MKKVIIFGLLDTAELAHYYISQDTDDQVVCFTVHKKYLPEPAEFKGLPVVAFEDLEARYDPNDFMLFAPMTGSNMNRDRESVYLQGKEKGYAFYSYISSKASVFDNVIGENCFILEDNTIQPFVEIGNNVVLWSGNHIGHHSRIDDHVFFTSHVVLSGHCRVHSYAWFGVNATIRNDCEIGEGSFISMAACVTRNTNPWSVLKGVPAKESGDSRELDF